VADVARNLLAVLVWPGLIGGAVLGWFFLGVYRKLMARMQGRRGPSLLQPFYDFVKLLGKQTLVPEGVRPVLFYGLPLISMAAMVCALGLLPAPGSPATGSFAGDLIVLLYLLEVPALCDVIAGYSTRSLYGEVSAAREALLSLGYNLPFLAAVIALAMHVGSFRLSDLVSAPIGPVHLMAGIAFLLAVPARLKSNPFSISNAEQELVAGTHTEFNGVPLALLELSHGLEITALAGFFAAICSSAVAAPALALGLYLLVSLAVVVLLTLVGAVTARLKVQQAFRFYWTWGALAAAGAFVAAVIW
jgi:NADH-quinone oxidoreductase subunit H